MVSNQSGNSYAKHVLFEERKAHCAQEIRYSKTSATASEQDDARHTAPVDSRRSEFKHLRKCNTNDLRVVVVVSVVVGSYRQSERRDAISSRTGPNTHVDNGN